MLPLIAVTMVGVCCAFPSVQDPPNARAASQPAEAEAEAPEPQRPLVATHYFYWYRWPTEHFAQAGAPGREGHRHHFVEPERVSYLDADWHERELRAMAACGIDTALPVYWGAPGAYDRPNLRFARDGLRPMVEALDRIAGRADGTRAVKLGLFYDTSTLLCSVRGVEHADAAQNRPDLTSAAGRALFCDTVVEYFERIPVRHWARFGDRPLVVLYASGFARKWDAALGESLRAAFARRFPGERPWLVADASWGRIGQDMTTSWGAALGGPQLHPGVAQIGPGYDDSPVPGRRTPLRDREDGGFYGFAWREAVRSRPQLVLIETWNEMHEGTEICETIETGRRYLDLTRSWTARLRAGESGPELPAPQPLRPRPDLSWGAGARDLGARAVDYGARPPRRTGLREIVWEDGPCAVEDGALVSRGVPDADRTSGTRYLYFQVSDHWRFDVDVDCEVRIERPAGEASAEVALDYDSTDAAEPLDGSYRRVLPRRRTSAETTITEVFLLRGARFANRQNGGADFRLVLSGPTVRVLRVDVR